METPYDLLYQRDRTAWNRFYEDHARELYGFIFRLLRGAPQTTADVFQDTWLDAIRNIEQFDRDRGEARAWLFGIARRRVALHWRRHIVQSRVATAGGEHGIDPLDVQLLPDEALEQLERAAVVRATLLALSGDHREVLTDKYVSGLTVEQIAKKHGKSFKAVESLLARAREQFRALLKGYFHDSTRKE